MKYRGELVLFNILMKGDSMSVKDTVIVYSNIAIETNNNIIFATQSGFIIGKPILEDEEVDSTLQLFFDLSQQMKEENKSENEAITSITLKDVRLSAANVTNHFPYLTVFMDQILGVSIGNLPE